MFRRRSGRLWCIARSGSTGFRRRFRRRSGRLWCRARQDSTGSREGSKEGSGRLWCRVRSGSTGFRRRFRRRSGRLWCSQVMFNKVPEKVLEKVWEALVQPGRFRIRSGRLWCSQRVPEMVPREGLGGFGAARSGSRGFRRKFQPLAERFAKIKRWGCWGYHRSLFFHILGIIIPTDYKIFFRGIETTNQYTYTHHIISYTYTYNESVGPTFLKLTSTRSTRGTVPGTNA